MRNPAEEGATGPGTVVGVNVALSGTLKDQNDIVVYGMVDGEVISDRAVTIGQTAQVKGPVRGQIITVSGTIRGSIQASEKLEITETGRVFGSIITKDLAIRSGAILVGKVAMGSDEGDSAESVQPETEEETVVVEVESDKNDHKKNITVTEEKSDEVTLTPDEE